MSNKSQENSMTNFMNIKKSEPEGWHQILRELNKYSGIIAIAITFLTAILSFFINLYERYSIRGMLSYFNIDETNIELTNNFIYVIVFSFAIIIYFLLSCYLFSKVKIKENIKCKHIFELLIKLVGLYILNYFFLIVFLQKFQCKLLIATLIICIIEYLLGYIYFTEQSLIFVLKGIDIKKNTVITLIIMILLIFVISLFVTPFDHGYEEAKKSKIFKIISDTKVIVYETKDNYYIENCEIQDNDLIIYTNKQTIISKDDITTTERTFNNVTTQESPPTSEIYDKVYSQLSQYEKENLVFTNYPDFAITLTADYFPIIKFKDDSKKEFEIEFKIINMTNKKQEIDELSICTYFMNPTDDYKFNPVCTDSVLNLKMEQNREFFNQLTFEPYEIKTKKYTLSCDQSFKSFEKAYNYLPIYYSMNITYKPQGNDLAFLSDNNGNIVLKTHEVIDFLY